jgi:hypothetical protein
MHKQPCVDKRPAGMTVKKPAARPVWLLLGLAAVVLAAMTRAAYGSPYQDHTGRLTGS